MRTQTKDTTAILVFFVAGVFALNLIDSLTTHILGIAFLISAIYGIVCTTKKKKFIF